MDRLDGKVALISGAARGIGGEAAQLMAREGAKVVVGDVLDDRGRQTVAAMIAAGGQAEYAHLDVTSEDDWTAAVNLAVVRFGRLDILVNTAGVDAGYMNGAGLIVDGGVTATLGTTALIITERYRP
jgi:NAD(P)-dependent dehydrogenase (short-subunit alcohol dehydrogenase family)